uniref:Cuticular protein n=1 Tax=Nilaparvata lugens TaxID=108931 RepID=A0A2S1ZS88_NILLU|nr:cuticular protein [Nilaparvata lugens]
MDLNFLRTLGSNWCGPSTLRRMTTYNQASILLILAILITTPQTIRSQRPTNGDKEVVLNIEDPEKTQYLEQNFNTSSYNFGYELGPDGQFHHENRGPDGVVYGCYGYIDPDGNLRVTHYLSDGWGYRVVKPGEDIELFLHPHEHHQEPEQSIDHESHGEHHGNHGEHHENHGENHEHHHEHHGQITPWKDLYFPKGCGNLMGNITQTPQFPGNPPVNAGTSGQPSVTGTGSSTTSNQPQRPGSGQGVAVGSPGGSSPTGPQGLVTGVRPQRPGTGGTSQPLRPSGQSPSPGSNLGGSQGPNPQGSRPQGAILPGQSSTKPYGNRWIRTWGSWRIWRTSRTRRVTRIWWSWRIWRSSRTRRATRTWWSWRIWRTSRTRRATRTWWSWRIWRTSRTRRATRIWWSWRIWRTSRTRRATSIRWCCRIWRTSRTRRATSIRWCCRIWRTSRTRWTFWSRFTRTRRATKTRRTSGIWRTF